MARLGTGADRARVRADQAGRVASVDLPDAPHIGDGATNGPAGRRGGRRQSDRLAPTGATDEGGASGWPIMAGDTALIVRVPEADPLVQDGSQAHVTVLVPFLPVQRIDAAVRLRLVELFGSRDSFDLTFARFSRSRGLLFLDPRPHRPVEALSQELTRRWPDAVPYWGIFGRYVAPHLTIARWDLPDTPDTDYDALESRLMPALPIRIRVRRISLSVWDGAEWRDHETYALR